MVSLRTGWSALGLGGQHTGTGWSAYWDWVVSLRTGWSALGLGGQHTGTGWSALGLGGQP